MRLSRSMAGFARSKNASTYSSSVEIPQKGLLTEAVAWRLLLLTALGPAFSNILIYRLGDFAITPSHLLLVLVTIWIFQMRRLCFRFGLVVPVAIMMFLEVCHALVSGYIGEFEWLKSFAQFVTYSICFLVLSSLRTSINKLRGIAPWAMKLGIFLGGVSVLQFALLNLGIPAYIPQNLTVKTLDWTKLVWRYGGFIPAIGLATEPSYYALGLVTLVACLLFLQENDLVRDQRLFWISLSTLFAGTLVTFSLTGIVMVSMMLMIWLAMQRRVRLVLLASLTTLLIGVIGANIGMITPIRTRLEAALVGADNSAQVRVAAAVQLLFTEPTSFESFAYGTGLGMEERELDTYLRIYREVSLRSFVQDEVKIHNILTTVRFFQGWLGVILYGILLWMLVLLRAGDLTKFSSVLLFFTLYHFASGLYLSPSFWTLLALIALLRRMQLERKGFSVLRIGPAVQAFDQRVR